MHNQCSYFRSFRASITCLTVVPYYATWSQESHVCSGLPAAILGSAVGES